MDRRTVVLGVAAAAAVGLAVFVSLPHHHHRTARDDVAAYVRRVNAVQASLRIPLTRVSLAYQHFAQKRRLGNVEAAELTHARATLVRVRRRLARLPTPPAARRLRLLVLRLIDDEANVTAEVAQIAGFLPRFDRVIRRVHAADVGLAQGIAGVTTPTSHRLKGSKKAVLKAQAAFAAASAAAASQQADVVDGYDAKLAAAAGALARLDPPPAFAPTYDAQLAALRATTASGAKLVAELRKPRRPDVAVLSDAFTRASRKSRSIAAQRAEIAALTSYNARVHALNADVTAVDRELQRLQRTMK